MMDKIAEFLVFGFVPLVVGILAAPVATGAAEQAAQREGVAEPARALVLDAAARKKPSGLSIYGQIWSLQFVDGVGAVAPKATFQVGRDGKATGRGPCNGYFVHARIKGSKLKFGKPGATMMACEEKLMKQEYAFFDALEKVASFRIEGGTLTMKARGGKVLLRFAAAA